MMHDDSYKKMTVSSAPSFICLNYYGRVKTAMMDRWDERATKDQG